MTLLLPQLRSFTPRSLLCAALFLLTGGAAGAEEFKSPHGYSITAPEGWVPIPADVIQQMLKQAVNEQARANMNWEAGYQLPDQPNWFTYPYLIIQYTPYGTNRQITETEMAATVKAISGADPRRELNSSLDAELRNAVPGKLQPVLDTRNHRFVIPMTMTVPAVGPVQGQVVGHFGRKGIVQVMFYAPQADWAKYQDSLTALQDSFHFDPEHAWDQKHASSGFGTQLMQVLRSGVWQGVICGVGAGIFGGIYAARSAQKRALAQNSKPKRKRPRPIEDE